MARAELVLDGIWEVRGFGQATSLAASAGLPAVPTDAQAALIQAEAQSLRWRDDGTAPTAAVGMVLAAGDSIFYTGDLSAFRVIEAAAGGICNVTYYGWPD